MAHSLSAIAFLAPDYDSGIAWFRDRLGFSVLEDRPLGPDKRWVVVGDPTAEGARFVVAKAEGEQQLAASAPRPAAASAIFSRPTISSATTRGFIERGVEFLESPRRESYGTVAVFKDPWGGNGI